MPAPSPYIPLVTRLAPPAAAPRVVPAPTPSAALAECRRR
jgi:hypothetical protein